MATSVSFEFDIMSPKAKLSKFALSKDSFAEEGHASTTEFCSFANTSGT